jgi:hypothetical protein
MKCDDALLSEYLDNELNADERTALEAHVTSCLECSGRIENYRRLRFEIRDEPLRRAPSQLRANVRTRIRERERQRRMRWVPLAIAAPVTVVGTLVGAIAMSPRVEPAPQLAVTATSPMNGATRVAPNGTVELWFDRELAPNAAGLAVTVDPPVPVRVSVEGNALRVEPDGAFEVGQSYTVAVESVVDVDGRRLKDPAVVSFATAPSALAIPTDLGSPRGVPSEDVASASPETSGPRISDATLPAIGGMPAPIAGASIEAVGLTAQTRKWPVSRSNSVQPVVEPSPAAVSVGEALGALQLPYQTVRAQEQAFQGGVMVRLGDASQTLVLQRGKGTWETIPQPPAAADAQADASLPPPPGALAPSGAFASVWQSVPSVRTALGWAVYEQRLTSALVQHREQGTVVTLGRMTYLLRSNGTWKVVPIARAVNATN